MTHHKLSRLLLVTTASFLVANASAFAQTVPDAAQGTASPGRVDRNLPVEPYTPRVAPQVEVKESVLQKAPAGAEKITFVLSGVQVDGMTLYTPAQIESLYADKLGAKISLADVYGIASALTNHYRNNGYILTQVIVPPQTIDGGIVHLKAVEGYIDTITVEGEKKDIPRDFIMGYASHVKDKGPLNVKELERALLLINDLPGISARSIISPSKTKTGAADLTILTERKVYDALISANNYGSRYLGPYQLSMAGSLNSALGLSERITGQVVVTPGSELTYVAAGYDQPIYSYGTALHFNINHSNTDPGFDLGQFDVTGHSDYMSVKVDHPLIRARQQNLTVYGLFDWRDVISKNIVDRREDSIRALRAGLNYEYLDTFLGAGANVINIELAKGLSIFGASDKGDANLSRALGDPEFTKLNVDMQRLQRVTSQVNLLVAAKGQLSSTPLLSAEEFGVGGMDIGRAFDSSEIIGDQGISGKLEVQWNTPQPIRFLETYQLFGFFDAGHVWNDDAAVVTQEQETATSTGFGVRATFPSQVKADFAVALPLDRDVQTQRDQDPRFYFNLSKAF